MCRHHLKVWDLMNDFMVGRGGRAVLKSGRVGVIKECGGECCYILLLLLKNNYMKDGEVIREIQSSEV